MRTHIKLVGIAALMSGLSTAAIAEVSKTEPLPQSLETSRAAESGAVDNVETFTNTVPRAESAETSLNAEAGDNTGTAVDSTLADSSIPMSLEDSDLAEAAQIEESNDRSKLLFANMQDGVIKWNDDEAAEMRAAILSNTMVKDALTEQGYDESDVVAAYSRTDGGLTLVVDG